MVTSTKSVYAQAKQPRSDPESFSDLTLARAERKKRDVLGLANNSTRLYVTNVRKKVPPGIYTLRYSGIAFIPECRMGIAHQSIFQIFGF